MKAGTIFVVTTGEYSDYGIYAMLRATRDLDFDTELSRWVETHPSEAGEYGFRCDAFMSDLVLSGAVEEVPLPKLHLANYSTVEKTPEKDAHPAVASAFQWVRACADHADCAAHPELGAACAARSTQPSSPERTTLSNSEQRSTK